VVSPPIINIALSDILASSRNNFEIDTERKNGWNPNSYKNSSIFLHRSDPTKPQGHRKKKRKKCGGKNKIIRFSKHELGSCVLRTLRLYKSFNGNIQQNCPGGAIAGG
jgi:hypothetical protein